MTTSRLASSTALALSLAFAAAAEAGERPAFEPTSNYKVHDICGWKVYVHQRLLAEDKAMGDQMIPFVRAKLADVALRLPKPAVEKLRAVKIWVEADSKVTCACYHPSRGWLQNNGFNPEKEKSIEFGSPKNAIAWSREQPAMFIHELAHAYHHQVLGYGQKDIKAAYAKAKANKSYESILHWNGKKVRHYALNNDQEYFAEATEAYFATNDFYPFVRAELKEHDPTGY
ncbi:hypothetical protein HQ560_14235, partial [bacterium]|nr:hypothetical protein [bacterium]